MATKCEVSLGFSQQVGALRRILHRRLASRLAERTARPVSQLLALRLVSRAEVETQAELAERLLIDAPAASRLVDRLEEDGLLRRLAGSDRRSVELRVTAQAGPLVAIFEEALVWLDRQILQHLSEGEIKAALRSMHKVQLGLSEAS